ncbi:MAG: dockerin type I repeat-containing protein [Candidatus Zixiibacteriota bacterium]
MKVYILFLIIFTLLPAAALVHEKAGTIENNRAMTGLVSAGSSENYQMLRDVMSGGAIDAGSETFGMKATLGQAAAGPAESESFKMSQGYWEDYGSSGGGCCNVAGDANNNDAVNILDVTFIISYLYKGGSAPVCSDKADANGNNVINILDVTFLITYLYKGGSAPICGTTGI